MVRARRLAAFRHGAATKGAVVFFKSNACESVSSKSIVLGCIFQPAVAEHNLLVEYLVPERINVKWCSTLMVSAVMTEAIHLNLRTDQIKARLLNAQSHGLDRCLGNTDFFNALTATADEKLRHLVIVIARYMGTRHIFIG